jgi:hypothetical protein
MSSHWRAAAIVMVTAAFWSSPARADQIALTSGILDLVVTSGPGASGGGVRIAGDRGFTFVGSMNGGFGSPVGDIMPPGTSIALEGGANGMDLRGVVTLDGTTFNDFGGPDSPFGGSIRIRTSPATLPSVLNAPSQITTAFMLDFIFAGSNFQHSLFGSGTATIFLDEDLGFEGPSWRVTGIRAVLSATPEPVPEPATLLLIGPALGWAALRRRSARS